MPCISTWLANPHTTIVWRVIITYFECEEGSEIRETYLELLSQLGLHHAELKDRQLTGFSTMYCEEWKKELMIVGRAVNGWGAPWRASDLRNAQCCIEIFNDIVSSVHDEGRGRPPMLWVSSRWGHSDYDGVTDYNTAKSAFWRVTRTVVKLLKLADIDKPTWPLSVVWTNLYKVSPHAGGNPGSKLCTLQFKSCARLLAQELLHWKPQRILMLTGMDWAKDFLHELGVHPDNLGSTKYVQAVCSLSTEGLPATIVVAKHPQGKKESVLTDEVVEAFRLYERQNQKPEAA
jgi:hypothetical protein